MLKRILEDDKMKKGIASYMSIMKLASESNINNEFKKKYKSFYVMHVARFSDHFYEQYFDYLKTHINEDNITFDMVYEYIKNIHLKRQPSFSSKLLHTINPNNPIYDSKVLRSLNITGKDPYYKYAIICEWYQKFNDTEEEHIWTNEFDNAYPEAKNITKVKKIDFILWRKPN